MAHLAIAGGEPIRRTPFPRWSFWNQEEVAAVQAVVESGHWGAQQGDQVRLFEFKFEEFEVAGRPVRERVVPLRTRYLFHDELQLLLETVGFQVLEVYLDYEESCYDGTGEMIIVARRPSLTVYNLPKENPRTGCIERK